jgi:hypothetical protein
MHRTTLMLRLNEHEITSLLRLCLAENRGNMVRLCESEQQAAALNSALDEIAWQLASSGHEVAIEALSTLVLR